MPKDEASDGIERRRTTDAARVLLIQTQIENAGAQEISRLVGAGLAARGHVVHHLFFYSRTDGASDLDSVEACLETRPRTPWDMIRFVVEARRRIARFSPDVVLTFQHWGNSLGAPLVRSVGPAPIVANQVSAPELINVVARALDRLWGWSGLYRLITTNSRETHAWFDRHPHGYRKRMIPVPYGCELKTSRLDRAGARAALGLPETGPILGCAARLHPSKRLDAAIAVLPHLPGSHLALAGQGPAEACLRALARSLGVADRVHFLGELQPTRIGDFLAALDVFVFPSSLESFGLAALEAAVAGVPVVASRIPVLREVLDGGDREAALFVDVDAPTEFAAAVARVLDDPTLAARLREAGQALRHRYSLDHLIEAYAALIERARSPEPLR